MKVITILGTRPEITKLSLLLPLLDQNFNHVVIHTGQHYDYNMDAVFFEELNIRKPDFMLGVGSGSQSQQTAKMMIGIEEILLKEKPDAVIVFADPNTPLAGALATVKLHIPLIHLEAGCRSFNKKMPEEINRVVCDHCADLLLAPDDIAKENLLREGLPLNKIFVVGSTAIEATTRNVLIANKNVNLIKNLDLTPKNYVLLTIHRAENTDDHLVLKGLIESINTLSELIEIVFPIHPRTKKSLELNSFKLSSKIKVINPISNLELLSLLDNALFVMSDSGGIQEEAAALNIPCLILRNETEWTYLTDAGKNLLLGTDKKKIISVVKELIEDESKIQKMKNVQLNLKSSVAEKIVEVIKNEFKR